MITDEMERDVHRLERIADRFSKIGSIPELKEEDLLALIHRTVDYLQVRVARRISLIFHEPADGYWKARLNAPLFEWVLENLIRNAVDALEGEGQVELRLEKGSHNLKIIISDNGKGMSVAQQRKVFRPGYTTKKRGWGLGLTLAKRIVEQYHNGQLSVLHSEPGKGTQMLVKVPKL
jgi:signal transduction histidine kinase